MYIKMPEKGKGRFGIFMPYEQISHDNDRDMW